MALNGVAALCFISLTSLCVNIHELNTETSSDLEERPLLCLVKGDTAR